MYKLSIFPNGIHICLQEIKHWSQSLSLLVRVKKMLIITQGATKHTIFVIRHHENGGIIAFFSFPQKSDTIISVENNSNSNLFLELMALEYTFQAWNNSSYNAELDRLHTNLNYNKYLNNICSFLHVEFVRDLKINNHITTYFRRVNIRSIQILFKIKAQSAKIAYNSPSGSIESKIRIDVCLASRTSKRWSNIHTSYLIIRKWRYPKSNRKRCLARQGM